MTSKAEDRKLKVKALLFGLACGLVVPMFYIKAGGNEDRGQAAAMFVGGTTLAMVAFWKYRRHVWYWGTTIILASVDVAFVKLGPWPQEHLSGQGLLPIGMLAGAINFWVFAFVAKFMKRLRPDEKPSMPH